MVTYVTQLLHAIIATARKLMSIFFMAFAALWSPAGKWLPSLLFCCLMFSLVFVTFPYGVLVQVWYSIVSILDRCLLPYFYIVQFKKIIVYKIVHVCVWGGGLSQLHILSHFHLLKLYLFYIKQNQEGHSSFLIIKIQRLIMYEL